MIHRSLQKSETTVLDVEEDTQVDRTSPGEIWSGETANRWMWHGKTSVSRLRTEKNAKNGLPDVLVTGWRMVELTRAVTNSCHASSINTPCTH